jgi:uncharacterized protein YbbC (DUF1343 family)/CubicO group peptidase (beta-lactamase class C family)
LRKWISPAGWGLLAGLLILGPAMASEPLLQAEALFPISQIVEEEIRSRNIPGAVVLIGHKGNVLYRKAFGVRQLQPLRPMTVDTIFDIASMTKAVATAPAILQLAEAGKLDIAAPVARYWPRFQQRGKKSITIRDLLIHYSGLPATLPLRPPWSGYETGLRKIEDLKPISPPGKVFLYGDVNFIILGELVRRVSGMPLDRYCQAHIFEPLGMKDTGFKLPPEKTARIAPTKGRGGEVYDPLAERMGGVAGNAGLFSTADDLALFAQAVLKGGQSISASVFSPKMIEQMTLPQSPIPLGPLRSMGWDLGPPLGTGGSDRFPAGSMSHRGYTGTFLWIDPISKTYVIVLTHRVYLNEKASAEPLRGQILTRVSHAIGRLSVDQILREEPKLAPFSDLSVSFSGGVRPGIDVLASRKFSPLWGSRVGLITNHTGRSFDGRRTIDLLYHAPGVKLKALFSPEHGPGGQGEGKIDSGKDPVTGLPIHSLYGKDLKPTPQMLSGLDTLVFDLQDAGARFYTYITTMGYAMEAAAEKNMRFFVLDRPNPITGTRIQGPILEPDLKSFTGYFPLPIRHGMTVGELARMFNFENRMELRLGVIPMSGYRRGLWYDETGLRWVNPSPNLRSLDQAILYPGVALVEGANVSVGRGTPFPFEIVGAPWIQGEDLADYLTQRNIPGVKFSSVFFTPEQNRFKGERCRGIRLILTDREVLDSPRLGLEIVAALWRLYPQEFEIDKTLRLIGARWILQAIREGLDPREIAARWEEPLRNFERMRSRYLLYLD